MSTTVALPRWDMTVVYPSLESPEFEQAFQGFLRSLQDLKAVFDRYQVGQRPATPVYDHTIEGFESVTRAFNDVLDELKTLNAYIVAFVSTDTRDDLAQAKLSELQQHMVLLSQLETRLTGWIGSMNVDELVRRSPMAADLNFRLHKMKIQAQHQMSQAEEDLAAELDLSGGTAWSKLHDNVTSQIMVPIERAGQQEEVSMSVIRNMAYDADREVRRRAYEAELASWSRAAVPLAAALNSIKAQSNTVELHRNWESPLDVALFHNNIDRPTLDAMMGAARDAFPDFRRYLHAKARALGIPALAWYDIFAPVGETHREWHFDQATEFLLDQFGSYSSRLRSFAERAFRERWIDAEPRPGKVDGAFCMGLRKDESRVLSNFQPTYVGMSTLAHELGHAYHNLNLAKRTPLQRYTPMTLAETASIFCETIVRHAALRESDESEQLVILQVALQGVCQTVVDISSRFIFETAVFEARRRRELSVDELNELMLNAQRATYGDGLDPNALHPYMWAVKGHYYSADRPYYNFPYMFGLLFGLGLYAQYQRDPEAFKASYDELLSSTGMGDAATLVTRFGFDIRSSEFWSSSLDIARADINRFEDLVNQIP